MIASLLRAFPEFIGKRRLARFLFKKKMLNAKDVRINGRLGCRYILPNIRENVAFSIFINGIYEQETFDFLRKTVPQDAVFLDLGTNIGSISIPLCKVRSDIKVIGIEASPWVIEYLNRNISENQLQSRITVYNYALYSEDNLKLPFFSPRDHFGQGTLTKNKPADKTITVDSITIDSLLKKARVNKVDFIKIDIEGFESFAFKGAKELFNLPDAPDILFEASERNERIAGVEPGSSQKILVDAGYKIYTLDQKGKKLQDSILTTGFYMLYASKK